MADHATQLTESSKFPDIFWRIFENIFWFVTSPAADLKLFRIPDSDGFGEYSKKTRAELRT